MLMRSKWIFYHQLASDRSEDVEEILRWLQWFVCPGFLCAVTHQISGTVIICQCRLSLALEHPEEFFLTGGHRINHISGFARTHCVYLSILIIKNKNKKKLLCVRIKSLWSQLLCACLSCRNTLLPVRAPRCSVMRFVFTHSRSVKLQGSEAAPRGPRQSILCARSLYRMNAALWHWGFLFVWFLFVFLLEPNIC